MKATIIADSQGLSRLTTFELEYPRFIHTHLLTHRVFSRNSSSSRAVPTKNIINHLDAVPSFWGANEPGMQSYSELTTARKRCVVALWHVAALSSKVLSRLMAACGAHKQVANRVTEPFAMTKTVVSATEWDNFFRLRCHPAADPTVQELAGLMYRAYVSSDPVKLRPGDWHMPYVADKTNLADDLMLSVSRCCQVSYRKEDSSLEKARSIYAKLNLGSKDEPPHASPTEHQAQYEPDLSFDIKGITHLDRDGNYWSGNFKGWVQFRQLL